jgi:hypothetical protein
MSKNQSKTNKQTASRGLSQVMPGGFPSSSSPFGPGGNTAVPGSGGTPPFPGFGGGGFPPSLYPGGSGASPGGVGGFPPMPFPGGGAGFPGGGPGFPGSFPGGFPSGSPQGGHGGGPGGAGGGPQSPPPSFTPQKLGGGGVSALAVDAGSIRRCVNRYVYIWQNNGDAYWMFLTQVGRNSISGYRWYGYGPVGFWLYFGLDIRRIEQFNCF